PEAMALLEGLLAGPILASTEDAVSARVLLGDALLAGGFPISATEHYSAVFALDPLLAPYASDWLGGALYAGGAYPAAAQVYSEALQGAETPGQQVWLLERIAATRSADGDYAGAMAAYDGILAIAQIPEYRARILSQAADTQLSL
ncbi:MAG: hypothetical protein MUF84_19960, partial [Anaerolineae bacterium]|nr:hypothetical protein [Anaerolineae bacterium]